MTTIAKLFADARLGIRPPVSARTEHFIDLDIAGERYHGSLFVGKHMRSLSRRERLRIWNCVISAHHAEREIMFVYSVQGTDANDALNQVERKVEDYATMMAGMV